MAPYVIKINTSDKGDILSTVLGKRIDEQVYSSFLSLYNDRPPSTQDDDIEVVLTTEGGDMTYSILIANIIANHKGKTIATIPKYAFSGGTVIALMCDEIHLCPNASIGPIDLQVFFPVKSVIPSMKQWAGRSWFCSAMHGILNAYQVDYIEKLRGLLEIKYTDAETVKQIIDFFYFKFNHNTPLFHRDIPDFLAHKVKAVDVMRTTQAPFDTGVGSGLDLMMNMIAPSLMSSAGGPYLPPRLHGPSSKFELGSESETESD